MILAFVLSSLLNSNTAQARLDAKVDVSTSQSIPKTQKGKTTVELANIFGSDNKVFVEHVLHLNRPLSKIGKLIVPDGSCTASLVGPDLILTAAHCIANSSGTALQQGTFTFHLGYHQGTALASSPVEQVWYGSFEYDRGERENDWAILRIRDSLGDTYGYFGWIFLDASDSRAGQLTQVGYGRLWRDGEEVTVHESCAFRGATEDPGLFLHDCDTSPGDSGSPLLFCAEPSDCRIAGIHAAEQRAGADHTLRLKSFDPKRPNLAVGAGQFIPSLWQLLGGQ